MVKIKICGITNLGDAKASAKLGVDFIGFIFAKSPRRITPSKAKKIIEQLPASIKKVGVFVNEKAETVNNISGYCGLDLVQLHGSEPPSYLKKIGRPVIKAFRIRDKRSLNQLSRYKAKAFLLDTYKKGKPGGTGETFNWDLAIAAKRYRRPVFLSGGLNPENILDAMKKVRPYAVDVSSGVEKKPGKKDIKKLNKLIKIVRKK